MTEVQHDIEGKQSRPSYKFIIDLFVDKIPTKQQ